MFNILPKKSNATAACVPAFLALTLGISLVPLWADDSWRVFRGNGSDGLALGAKLPRQWSESENVAWKVPVHGRGWSSPVVDGNQVWMTTATEDGQRMFAVCVDLQSGAIIHDKLLFENTEVQPDFHVTNSYASPTPVLDDAFVYVSFGAYGTACLRRDTAEVVWQRRDLKCNHYRGAGSSPILVDDKLIFHMDGYDFQYAIALDRKTGETIWKADREVEYGTDNGDFYKAYSTPTLIEIDGRKQLISLASMVCLALDPDTGKEIWRVRYDEHSTTVRPIFDGERLYFSTGFSKATLMCVRVDGHGDVTDSHVDWIQSKSIGSKPSPVLVNGYLFSLTDDGILCRIDRKSGDIAWRLRLGGKFSASLLATSECVYAFDHDGKSYVVTATEEPELLFTNTLDEGCNASPAVAGDRLLLRTTSHLYLLAQEAAE